jgi:hypothetical protein
MTQDWTKLAADLERLLKLRAIPFGAARSARRTDGRSPPPAKARRDWPKLAKGWTPTV